MNVNRRTLVLAAVGLGCVVFVALAIGQWSVVTGNLMPAAARWVLTAAGSLVLIVGTPVAVVWIVRGARRGPMARTVFMSVALLAAVTAFGALVGGPVGRTAVNVAGVPLIAGGIAAVATFVTPMGWALMGAGVRRMQQNAAASTATRQEPDPAEAGSAPVHDVRSPRG